MRLDADDQALLRSFNLSTRGRSKVGDALALSPEGTLRCAREAALYASRHGGTGAGLLVTMLERDEHLQDSQTPQRRPTGWRFVRGTHSGTYVRDRKGTDPLPAGYGVDG